MGKVKALRGVVPPWGSALRSGFAPLPPALVAVYIYTSNVPKHKPKTSTKWIPNQGNNGKSIQGAQLTNMQHSTPQGEVREALNGAQVSILAPFDQF